MEISCTTLCIKDVRNERNRSSWQRHHVMLESVAVFIADQKVTGVEPDGWPSWFSVNKCLPQSNCSRWQGICVMNRSGEGVIQGGFMIKEVVMSSLS